MKNLTIFSLAFSLILVSSKQLFQTKISFKDDNQSSKSVLFLFNEEGRGLREDLSARKMNNPSQSGETQIREDIIPLVKSAHIAAAGSISPETQALENELPNLPQVPGGIPFYGVGAEYASFACILPADFLTDCYGTPRGPENRDHRGYDYAMTLGIESWPVYTPLGGAVTYAGPDPLLGNLLVVESAGYQWLLGHNAEILVTPGQVVRAGDLVAYAGNTGDSTFPHTHSEFRRCWAESGLCIAIDPLDVWLPGQTTPCDWEAGQVISYTLYNGDVLTCGAGIDGFQLGPVQESPLNQP